MADILTEDGEHENMYRHLRVVIDETKEVFVQLFHFFLTTIPETYEEFIERNAHDIYHFCYPDRKCCQCQCQSCSHQCPSCICPPHRKHRVTGKRILFPKQLDIFLDTAGTKLAGHDPTYRSTPNCCCPVNAALTIDNLDVSLARFLLLNFTTVVQTGTPERKALDDLVEMRNNFAHAAKSRMSNREYKASLNTTKQLLVLAKVYGKEQETKDKLDVIGHEPFNVKVCIDLLNTLLLQAHTDSDIKETVKEIAEIVKELKENVPKSEQTTPEFILKDIQEVTVVEGADACFEIWLKDKTVPVKWFKNNDEIITDSDKMTVIIKDKIHRLFITRCCEEDKGLYGVQIKDTCRKALLNIKDYYTRNLKDVNCIEGDNVTLDCEIRYSDMKAQWYKDGIKVESTCDQNTSMEQTRHTMNIPCVEMNDSGRYEIDIHERRRSARLTVESYFTNHLEEKTCTEGDTVNFICEVIEDNTTAKWFLNDNEIVISPRTERETSGRQHKLTIVNALVSDSGNYSVIVNNSRRKATLYVEGYYTRNLKHVSCIEGDAVSFDCEVIFSGMNAQWYKDGIKIESTSKRYTTIEQKRHMLIIPCVEMNDNGWYEIDIQDRRRSVELRIESYFTKYFEEIKCTEGETVQFVCEVIEENTTANWFLNGAEIETSHRIKCETSGRQHKLTVVNALVSDSGEYSVIVKNSKRKATLCVEDNKIKRAAYLEDIKKKTERRFYIRVMIVGEHGVGKSCLLRRLLGEGIEGVESTDGIDIVVRRCKIRLSDGKWIFDSDQDPKREYAARIKRAIAQETRAIAQETLPQETLAQETQAKALGMTTFDQNTEHSAHDIEIIEHQEEVQLTVTAEDKLSGHQPQTFALEQKTNATQERDKPSQPRGSFTSTIKNTKVLTHEVEQALEHFLYHIDKYEKENEEYIEIGFWDFAGEKDYYGTHYTFLDSHALYLLVTDCSVDIKQTEPCVTYDSIGSYIDFWFDTIHNCRDVEEDNTDKDLDPPIIAVCTGLDQLTGKVKEKKDTYELKLIDAIRDGQKRNHLRDVCFVSNTEQSGSDFDHVRKLIFDWGKKLQSFGRELPLKWIRLEQSLDVVREGGYNVIAREDVIDLAKKCDIHKTEEVEQFLKHQHKMGSIIYCEDIQNYVILKQQWLADAFKCLVSDKIDTAIKKSDEWATLLKTGILEISLITKLFQKEQKLEFSKYDDHILQVFNKFDIVGIDVEQDKNIYYMPYMIKPEFSPSLSEIVDHFGVSDAKCRKTPWLCYEFDFFPLPFFTYVMLFFIRSYKMCRDRILNKRSIYHGVGVFFLDQKRDHQFIVLFCKNTVAFQIWHWEDFQNESYQKIRIKFQKVIDNLKMKYIARNFRYDVKVKCPEGDVNSQVGRMSYRDMLDESNRGNYFCDEHKCKHDSSQLLDTWFYNYSNESTPVMATSMNAFQKRRSWLVVAAIDLGTILSGYCFSFLSDFEANRNEFFINEWSEEGVYHSRLKTPSILLLNPDQSFKSFGYRGQIDFKELVDNAPEQAAEHYYVKKFKMQLYNRIISLDMKIKDEMGKEILAIIVFTESIRFLKDHVVKKFEEKRIGLTVKDIFFVITVPTIWSDAGKQFMREASEKAGIESFQMMMVYETEALLNFCLLPENQGIAKYFQEGRRLMIVDLGGGTTDITVVKVIKREETLTYIQHVDRLTGGACGGITQVHEKFEAFLNSLLGFDVMGELKREYLPSYIAMMEKIEIHSLFVFGDKKCSVMIAGEIIDIYRDKCQKDLKKELKETMNDKIKLVGDKLVFDASIVKRFYQDCVQPIIGYINETMKRGCAFPSTMILVGGFSEAPLIREAIIDAYPVIKDIVSPVNSSFSVLKGSVLFGHQPKIVTGRVCRETLGVSLILQHISKEVKSKTKRSIKIDGELKAD